jgi:Uma2 family endonuclease
MSAAREFQYVTVGDYLAGEFESQVKHEYLGGIVYAMAGGRNVHNLIASNFLGELRERLRGKSCRPYNSNTKIRVHLPTQVRFYYPDGSVICRPNPANDSFQDQPTVVAEVISKRTRRVDEGEKKDAYLTIPSLAVYLLVEQDLPAVTAYRRTEHGFIREDYRGMEASIPLGEIGAELPLAELYGGVEFVPEPDDEEA